MMSDGRRAKMNIINLTLEELKPYAKNPRKNDEAVKYVAESIAQFGFKVPIIVDANNVIVAGHTRYRAARQLGLEEVPCIVADDLTEEQIQAFRLADNKVGEIATWDDKLLKIELDDIVNINMEDFGFDLSEEEIEEMEQKPEYEFTQELLESHNYIVLTFDNEMDWQVAQEKFGIKSVLALDSKKGYERKGVGRVIKGADILPLIKGGEDE